MGSAFADLWADVQVNFDNAFAEPVTLIPQVGGDAGEYVSVGPDTARPMRDDLTGIFTENQILSRVVGSGANSRENPEVQVASTQISLDADQFAQASDLPHPGDVVAMTDRPGQPRYQITTVEPNGYARVTCRLVYIGLSP